MKPGTGATLEEQDYVCMQIDGEGMTDGSRLLELTQPLAKAGVSILFITTYFSDYVLVASQEMKKVRKVLLDKGFYFGDLDQSFMSSTGSMSSPAVSSNSKFFNRSPSPTDFDFDEDVGKDEYTSRAIHQSFSSSDDETLHSNNTNTLQFLRQGKIPVTLSRGTKLLMVGTKAPIAHHAMQITKLFLSADLPKFFSLTQAPETNASMLLTEKLVDSFEKEALLGVDTADILIPITLDLSQLDGVGGLGGCGIVCGVVDELMQRAIKPSPASLEQMLSKEELVMSYLSTVVTGNVLIREQDIGRIGPTDECKVM